MKWTSETPTEPGLYRHCFQNSTLPEGLDYSVANLVRRENGKLRMDLFGEDEWQESKPHDYGCWYGPIKLPDYGEAE